METIFVISVINYEKDRIKDDRTWGWFHTFKDAENIVLNNSGDIFEVYYNYAVIEEVEPGFYHVNKVRGWYKADYENRMKDRPNSPTVIKCKRKPNFAKSTCNFTMG